MTTTLDTTRDVLEILRLNARYNLAVDTGDAQAWADCFTPDGVFHALLEGHTPRGTQQLREFVPVCAAAFGEMHHLTTNEIVDVTGDTATQTCYLQFFAEKDGRLEGSVCLYRDELRRTETGWAYADRTVEFKRRFTAVENG